MGTKYLVLPRIAYRGANAMTAWWCAGAPGPMAARGLANALANAMAGPQGMAQIKGASVVHHDVSPRAERIRETRGGYSWTKMLPHQLRAASFVSNDDYAGGGTQLSAQPTFRCDGVATMVIAMNSDFPVATDQIEDFLRRARFAGGSIEDHCFNPKKPLLAESLHEAAALVRTGYAFHDQSELLALQAGERDALDAFIRATRHPKSRNKDELAQRRDAVRRGEIQGPEKPKQQTWLQPYLAAFRRISRIDAEAKSREGLPHAFVEPMVGLAALVSLRDPRGLSLWDYQTSDGMHSICQFA